METQNLLWIVPIIVLAGFCYCLWKAGRYREPDKEIYEKELNKCPFDGKHCVVMGRSLTDQYITKTCEKCPRYINWKNKKL